MKKYRCKVCGFVVETEKLDEDYVCPLCGVPHTLFEEVIEEEQVDEEIDKRIPILDDNPCIARIMEKCINCGKCKDVCENIVGIKYKTENKLHPACLGCGGCILNCPMGALVPKYQYLHVLKEIHNPEKVVVALTSPAVRVSLGECFGADVGTNVEDKMITALRRIGFDYVFDTTFGADLTIMEEASELVDRIKNNKNLPMFTSCCPAWIKYAEIYHKELLDNISTCKSPIGMHTTMIKTYFAKKMGLNPENIVTVALTPCTAKKQEKERKQLDNMCDYVITASEAGIMFKENNINLLELESGNFDTLFSKGSGGGIIFGNTGGVMESALREAYFMLTNKNLEEENLEFLEVRGLDGVKESTINIDGLEINVAVVQTMPNLEKLLDMMKKGTKKYHFVEVMNCMGGCIGGGGQPLTPIPKQEITRISRIQGLYNLDKSSKIRVAHENPDIIRIYDEFLNNSDCNVHELLHTTYEDKSRVLEDLVSLK